MKRVFQEIMEQAIAELRKALDQELEVAEGEEWDPDAFEEEVRKLTQQLGQQLLQVWAEVRAEQAQAQAPFCASCGRRRHLHRWQPFWWLSTFGRIETQAPYLRCPDDHSSDRPFQRLTGQKCQGKSLALQRVLTDFGAEKSFAKASEQLVEHYGVELNPSSVREVVERQAQRAEELVGREHQEAIKSYGREKRRREGEPWLIVESDGSLVRTGELEPDPEGGLSPKRQRPRRRRLTQWREVRLSTVEVPGEEERQYGAVLGSPPEGRRADVCPGNTGRLWRGHLGAWGRRWSPLDCSAGSRGVPQAPVSAGPVSPDGTSSCRSYGLASKLSFPGEGVGGGASKAYRSREGRRGDS
jgi:hypothetical protein